MENEAGPVDVLVNNAGVGMAEYFADASNEHLRHTTEVNYLAPAELCRQVIPRMFERGGGHIVNVSSMAGCAVFPGLVTYAASKAALSQFTWGLRADLGELAIGTTLVELGASTYRHAGPERGVRADGCVLPALLPAAVAWRAAVALDSARLDEERAHVADLLTRALRLPEIEGVRIAARYRPHYSSRTVAAMPLGSAEPAQRDLLVITFAPRRSAAMWHMRLGQ